MTYIRLSSLAVCFAVVGCTTGVEITSDTVTPSVVKRIPIEQSLGSADVTVRTYVEDSAGKKTEVSGVACRLRSSDISARVVTPARVALPIYVQGDRFAGRGQPSPLEVSCQSSAGSTTTEIPASPNIPTASPDYYYSSQPGVVTINSTPQYGQLASSYPWTYGAAIALVLE